MMLWLATMLLVGTNDRWVESARYHVRMEVPPGWTVRQQTAYPGMVAQLKHPDGSQLALSTQPVGAGETPKQLAERSRASLARMGLEADQPTVSPGGADIVVVNLVTRDKKMRLRQLYAIHGRSGFVLTLTAPAHLFEAHTRDLDAAWRGLTYLDEG